MALRSGIRSPLKYSAACQILFDRLLRNMTEWAWGEILPDSEVFPQGLQA